MFDGATFESLFAVPLRNGVSYSAAKRGSGVPMVNMGEIFKYDRIADQECELAPLTENERKTSLLEAGDLLFARQSLAFAGAGKCAIVLPSDVERTWESHIIRVRMDLNRSEPAYYFYYFASAVGRRSIETIIHQVAAAGIRGSDLAQLTVPVPPLSEQRAIAEVLGALDDKIAANTTLAESSERFIAAHFDRAVQDSITKPLFEVVDVHFGEAFKGAHFAAANDGRPLIRIRDLKTFAPQVWTTENRKRELVVEPGEILVGMDAEFRPTAWLGVPGLLNQRVCRMQSGLFGSAYLLEALRRPLNALENEKSATTVIHLNKGDLARATIDVPTPEALERFEQYAEPVFSSRVALASQNRTLAATRDALLPQLMSGKLRVKDAENQVSEVV